MFRKKAIDEWALDYWLLQQYAKLCFRIYYRKIEIINKENIPVGYPVILAPNHQNALMDAMVLVCNFPFQNVFLARADIFKGKRLTRFLTYLNIMPIYRIRDGIEKVKKNDEVFDKTVTVLHNANNPLVLFPEGNHGDKRRLRTLVKGLFRIAFMAQEKFGDQPGVKVVPIGIDYGHYQHFRSTLFVNIGKPIEVAEFYSLYRENPVAAVNEMKDKFADALSGLMIDIQSEEYYDLYMHLRSMYNDRMREKLQMSGNKLADRFIADKRMIEILNQELEQSPENISQLNNDVLAYQNSLEKLNFRDHTIKKGRPGLMRLLSAVLIKLMLLPVFIFGFINNILPYHFAASRVKNIKDTQFHSSFKYVIGMLAFPLWYLIVGGILALCHLPFKLIPGYIVLMPLTGLASFTFYIRLKKMFSSIRASLKWNSAEIMHLQELRQRAMTRMDEIINKHFHENSR